MVSTCENIVANARAHKLRVLGVGRCGSETGQMTVGLMAFVMARYSDLLLEQSNKAVVSLRLKSVQATDLVSQSLLQIGTKNNTKRPALDKDHEWRRYLPIVVRNIAVSAKRSETRREAREAQLGLKSELRKRAAIERTERSECIRKDIDEIVAENCDAGMREAFQLWCDGKTRAEMADIMGASKTTVNGLLYKALAILRPRLQRRGW